MSHAQAHNQPHAYDPSDPHGFHEEGHHGHVIVPWQILLGVLLALLAFTVLTVFQAQFEKYAAHEWGWQIPGWVNVVLAMGIACIKGTLVVMYFMQLRYDKGLNVILLLFTLFAVWLFIMFTAIDLNNRGHITDWRAGEITSGGTGVGVRREGVTGPLIIVAKDEYIKDHGEAEYEHELHAHHATHGGQTISTAQASRSREGLTPGLFSTGVWEHLGDDHDARGDAHTDGAHAEEADHSASEEHADENHDAGGH